MAPGELQEAAQGAAVTQWHDRSIDAVLSDVRSSPSGLSGAEAEERLRTCGPNRLPEPPRRSLLMRFLLQFHNILIYVLLGAAVVTTVLEHYIDAMVILAVVVANAVIGFVQEGKAERAMDAIRKMLAPRATVLRDGERRTIPGESLVRGDIVALDPGDKVPADVRLTYARGLQIQEAILTGESMPVEKGTAPAASDAPLGDRTSMAFSGTLVTSGQGRGVVVETAGATEIGRISGMISEVQPLTTPLVQQMSIFARWLAIFVLSVAALVFVFGYFVATTHSRKCSSPSSRYLSRLSPRGSRRCSPSPSP